MTNLSALDPERIAWAERMYAEGETTVAAIAAELGIRDWQFWALRQLKGWNHRCPDVARTVSAAWARRRARRASPDPGGGGAGSAEDAALAGSAEGDAAAPRDVAAPRAAAPSRPRARRREDARALGLRLQGIVADRLAALETDGDPERVARTAASLARTWTTLQKTLGTQGETRDERSLPELRDELYAHVVRLRAEHRRSRRDRAAEPGGDRGDPGPLPDDLPPGAAPA